MPIQLPRLSAVSLMLCLLPVFLTEANAESTVRVDNAYVRAVPPTQNVSAAFMSLRNESATDRRIVAAESPVAKTVELHAHIMKDGMMRMRQVEKIDLPAGQDVALKPGGLHIMLIGLKQKLVPGENVGVTLILDDGSRATINATVKKLAMKMQH